MKAYFVSNRFTPENGVTVIFAENAGKAKALALNTDIGEDSEYTELSATRVPELDKFYRGLREMDWDNPEDRIAMVTTCGIHCCEDYVEIEDCRECPAREFCEWKLEENDEDDY